MASLSASSSSAAATATAAAPPLSLLLRSTSFRSCRWTQQSFAPSPSPCCSLSFSSSFRNPRTLHRLHHHRHQNLRSTWFLRAAPSPVPEPPPPEDPVESLQVVLSTIRDRLQIFFAVLFWMSLFFWSSIWDGGESSRNKKGPWFRK